MGGIFCLTNSTMKHSHGNGQSFLQRHETSKIRLLDIRLDIKLEGDIKH